MFASTALNGLWAVLSLTGVAWVGWKSPSAPRRWGVRLIAAVVLAGFLFPVISASDDGALWQREASQQEASQREASHQASGSALAAWQALAPAPTTAAFWLLFSHLQTTAAAPQAPRAQVLARLQAAAPDPFVFLQRRARSRAPPAAAAR